MPTRSKELNLLPKEVWEKGAFGQLITWVLSVGRHVVIFTELIVIGAFLFRFSLDRVLTDLHASIKTKQSIIASYGDLEANFRQIQNQLSTVKQISDAPLIAQTLDLLSQMVPVDTTLTSLTINQKEVVIEGFVATQNGLATLLNQAQGQSLFSDVVLDSVKSTPGQLSNIEFTMILTFKSAAT